MNRHYFIIFAFIYIPAYITASETTSKKLVNPQESEINTFYPYSMRSSSNYKRYPTQKVTQSNPEIIKIIMDKKKSSPFISTDKP